MSGIGAQGDGEVALIVGGGPGVSASCARHFSDAGMRVAIAARTPDKPVLIALEKEFEVIVRKWVMQVRRLGIKVYGLWELGFDTGDGYLCWRHPEIRLAYFLEHGEDFQGRRPLKSVIEETQPEWAFR